MTNYKVTMYQACMLHTEIQAETPEQALEMFKSTVLYSFSLKEAVDSIEIDEDYAPTRIVVSLSEEKDSDDCLTTVLVEDTPDVQTLKNLLSVPQTESEYTRLVDVIALALFEAVNDNPESPLCPLLDFVCGLISAYEGRQTKYHIIKSSRGYEGRGYCGVASDHKPLEFNDLNQAIGAAVVTLERNPVGWCVYDSQTSELVWSTARLSVRNKK